MAATLKCFRLRNKITHGFRCSFNYTQHQTRYLSTANTFKYDDLEIQLAPTEALKPKPDPNALVFGREFSDHMLEVKWTSDEGWEKPVISPVHSLSLHPAAKCLHYAVELFEGMKAYRGEDNKIRIFRPKENMKRMNSSAKRACLPEFDGQELIKCMKRLITIDQEWVPYSQTSTLYIRPTLIGTEGTLGVSGSNEALLFVLIGPVGPYYPTGMKPVSLLADPSQVRAYPGGAGSSKMGSNYGPTIFALREAIKNNCQQVLWLYGEDHQLTEVGTMNIFMFWLNENGEKELVTPPLDTGIILPGVTRKSLLELARQWGEFKVSERVFTMKDVLKGLQENRILEVFGSGTACVVSPVEKILYQGSDVLIPTMKDGAPLSMRFTKELTDIQFGNPPNHPWARSIDEGI